MENLAFYRILYDAIGSVKIESLEVMRTLKSEVDLYNLSLHSLGFDSIEMFELIGYFEDNYAISVDDSDVFSLTSVGELYQLIELSMEAA